MTARTPLGEVADAIAEGLAQPRHEGELLAIVVALVGGMVLARALAHWVTRRRLRVPADVPAAAAHLRRLLFPLITLLLLGAGAIGLRVTHMVNSAADARLLRLA